MPKETVYNTKSALVGQLINHPKLGVGLVTDYRIYPSTAGQPTRQTYTVMWEPELGTIEMETSVIDESRIIDINMHFPK
jgi:hypothetical protein